MGEARFMARRMTLDVAVFACLALLVGGFAFVSQEFGSRSAAVLSPLFAPPLVVAVRLHLRCAVGSSYSSQSCSASRPVAVCSWCGLDRDYAEDVRWAEFKTRLRQDPAFWDVRVNKSERKDIHWASGTVASEADLDRLRSLAAECGIERRARRPLHVQRQPDC